MANGNTKQGDSEMRNEDNLIAYNITIKTTFEFDADETIEEVRDMSLEMIRDVIDAEDLDIVKDIEIDLTQDFGTAAAYKAAVRTENMRRLAAIEDTICNARKAMTESSSKKVRDNAIMDLQAAQSQLHWLMGRL